MKLRERSVDVVEAILKRQSVRRFRREPVAPELIREILEVARFAPSTLNTQPWEVAVVTGQRLEAVREALTGKFRAGIAGNPDLPTSRYPDHVNQRRRENGLRLYDLLGIRRGDSEKEFNHFLGMQRFFEAPVGLMLLLDRDLPVLSMFDLGMFAQTLMLAAVGLGLSTCAVGGVVSYPDVLRALLDIPATKHFVFGFALGYADDEAEINTFRSNRIPVGDFVRWYEDEA